MICMSEMRWQCVLLWACLFAACVPQVAEAALTVTICDPASPGKFLVGDLGEFRCAVKDAGDMDYYIIWEFSDTNFTWPDPEGEYVYFANEDIYYELNVPGAWKVTCTVIDPTGHAVASDQITVYVLAVINLELLSSGACPAENNDKLSAYQERTKDPVRQTLGLGAFHLWRQGWGVAVRGAVTPEAWPDPLVLTQNGLGGTFWGENGDVFRVALDGDDMYEDLRDSSPPILYYMDYPGVKVAPMDQELRIRANFENVVHMGTAGGRPCSNTLQWCTAQSWHYAGDAWCTYTDPEVAATPGDNQLWVGRQLSGAERDWDMQ